MTGIIINNQERKRLMAYIQKALGRTFKNIHLDFQDADYIFGKGRDVSYEAYVQNYSGDVVKFRGKMTANCFKDPRLFVGELCSNAGAAFAIIGMEEANKG